MPFTENQAVAIHFPRVGRIDRETIEVEIHQDVGNRKRAADVAGAGIEYRTKNQLSGAYR